MGRVEVDGAHVRVGAGAAVDHADLDVFIAELVGDAHVAAGERAGVPYGVGDQFGRAYEEVVADLVGEVGERFAEPPADLARGPGLVGDAQPLWRRYRSGHRGPLPSSMPWGGYTATYLFRTYDASITTDAASVVRWAFQPARVCRIAAGRSVNITSTPSPAQRSAVSASLTVQVYTW